MSSEPIIDPYAEAAALISRLKECGLASKGDDLQDAMDLGSTGTEIFMALRWHLGELLKGDVPDDVRTTGRALEKFLAAAVR